MSFHDILLSASATTCFLFVFIVISLPVNDVTRNKSNVLWLLVYFTLIGVLQTLDIVSDIGDTTHLLIGPLGLLLGPLFYSYILQNTPHTDLKPIHLFGFCLPAAIALVDIIAYSSGLQTKQILEHRMVLQLLAPIELIFVTFAAYRVQQFLNIIQSKETDVRTNGLLWLRWFCYLNAGILLIEIALPQILHLAGAEVYRQRTLIIAMLMLFLLVVAFRVIRQPAIVYSTEEKVLVRTKYGKSGLTPDLSRYYQQKLNKLMEEDRFYLDNELTLAGLGEKVGLNTQNLSQLLNETFSCSYHDYINKFRVEHAKTLLLDTRFTVQEVGIESGFNTKVAFYNSFKKYEGCTPGTWRKQIS